MHSNVFVQSFNLIYEREGYNKDDDCLKIVMSQCVSDI